ncbi:MAG TPA: FAD-binding protein [Streptosporangiaceae bacterium]|nr:FAD-binding protein [Streptosporangiaceae bacterium]
MTMPLRVAVLAKQIPRFEDLRLGADGRLVRDRESEINPYCRRAIAKGVELARATGGSCTAFTLGPPQAADVLAEAIAWGADDGVLVSDPAFAGSDTLATSRALAAAITRSGPFDLVIAGLNSVDGDTGQVGPQLAELLDLPMVSGVRELSLDGDLVIAGCERDDGFVTAAVRLPVLLTAAERLCPPCKVPPSQRGDAAQRIRVLTAADLGSGPWGQQGSPTEVGEVRVLAHDRRRIMLAGPLDRQVRRAADLIRQAAGRLPPAAATAQVARTGGDGPVVAVVAEPRRLRTTAELLGAAARLAASLGGRVTLLTLDGPDAVAGNVVDSAGGLPSGGLPSGGPPSGGPPAGAGASAAALVWAQGADTVISLEGVAAGNALAADSRAGDVTAEDVAAAVAAWARPPGAADDEHRGPWAILAPSSSWGREVAGRVSVLLGAGLTGDAVGLEVADGRLVSWKPAFGGQLVAAVTARSAVQLATVRPGVLPALHPRAGQGAAVMERRMVTPRGRVTFSDRRTNDEPERLALATSVVCVGQGVDPSCYGDLTPLLDALGAELAGTRKVTDAGWLPRSRQVGITGRAVSPAVYLLLGASGKFNHMVGTRSAGLVVAVNTDPDAPVFDAADIGIVGDWALVAPLLAAELAGEPLDVLA